MLVTPKSQRVKMLNLALLIQSPASYHYATKSSKMIPGLLKFVVLELNLSLCIDDLDNGSLPCKRKNVHV